MGVCVYNFHCEVARYIGWYELGRGKTGLSGSQLIKRWYFDLFTCPMQLG